MTSDPTELKARYDKFAESLDYKTTACDYQLRELEINLGASYMSDGQRVLDACAAPGGKSSMLARAVPKRSAKYRRLPATAPQLPATEVFEMRASCPSTVRSSSTSSNGAIRASRSMNAARRSRSAYGIVAGNSRSSAR